MVRDKYLHDVARILDIPPRAVDVLKTILLLGEENEVVLDAEAKIRICEAMGLFSEYQGNKFPNVALVQQFIQVLAKKGALVKRKRSTYSISPLFSNLSDPIELVITYSRAGREMKINTPQYGKSDSNSSSTD